MGGAESRTMDIYRNIDRNLIQFDFAIHTNDECYFTNEIKELGGRIHCLPRFNGKNYFNYKKAWEELFKKNKEYQIIHGHQTSTGFIYLAEAKRKEIPIRIAHSRNSNKDTIIKKYTSKLTKYYATHLFAVSQLAALSEFGNSSLKKDKVNIIPNAIDAQKYVFKKNIRVKKRRELEVEDNVNICHIGRFHPQKNHSFLLEIFKVINDENPKTRLFLVGEGPLKETIQRKISDLGLGHAVILTGVRSDIPEFLQAMDLLLFPSLFEGLPGVVLEAQASGMACVISSNITQEVHITNLVKRVSLSENKENWAKAVMDLLNKTTRKNTLQEIVSAGYDKKSVTEWYQNFYITSVNNEL